MDFRRAIGGAAAQGGIFLCGLAAVFAWVGGFYVTALLATVTAIALGAITVARLNRPQRQVEPAAGPQRLAVEQDRVTLRAIIDQAPAPLLILTETGDLRAVNRAARLLFAADDRIADPPEALIGAVRDLAPGARVTLPLQSRVGERLFALSVAEIDHQRLAVLIDVQAEVQAAEAAALRELLQVLSHEIMNSLTPIASLAQTARELVGDGSAASDTLAREALETVARRADGLQRFVAAYRELARLPAPSPRPVMLSRLLDDVAGLFNGRWSPRGVHLALETSGADFEVTLDPDMATQALLNLLANGAEAALAAGREPPIVTLHVGLSAGRLELLIEDNGPGVDAESREKIFRPFYTTKPEGSGIGLSLARQIITSLGGDLSLAEFVPGAGAVFVIRL